MKAKQTRAAVLGLLLLGSLVDAGGAHANPGTGLFRLLRLAAGSTARPMGIPGFGHFGDRILKDAERMRPFREELERRGIEYDAPDRSALDFEQSLAISQAFEQATVDIRGTMLDGICDEGCRYSLGLVGRLTAGKEFLGAGARTSVRLKDRASERDAAALFHLARSRCDGAEFSFCVSGDPKDYSISAGCEHVGVSFSPASGLNVSLNVGINVIPGLGKSP